MESTVELVLIIIGFIVILLIGLEGYLQIARSVVEVSTDDHLQQRLDMVRNDESQAFIDRGQS